MPRLLSLVILAFAFLALAGKACFAAEGTAEGATIGTDERQPVPSKAEIAKAKQLVKELLGSEIAGTKPAGRAALAAKLLKQGDDSKDDAAGRYVLLCDARDMAVRAGDPLTAIKAAESLEIEYQVTAGTAREPLAALSTAPMNVDTCHVAADVLMSCADAAIAGDDCDAALSLLKAADAIARKSRNYPVSNQAKTRTTQVEKLRTESAAIKQQQEKLKESPDDPAANLAVGKHLCMVKRDWDAAMPYLVKGASGALKAAVDKDIKAVEGDDAAKIAAADAWYDMAAKAGADTKPCLQLRAYHWYLAAAPTVSGLNKAKAEKRMTELQAVAETAPNKNKMWLHVRRALADEKLKRWKLVGGAFSRAEFEEIPAGGALLVGFRYTLLKNGLPSVIQPIFLTASGEVLGKIYGMAEPTDVPQIIKAKPGYAVGAIYVRGGGGLDAFQPIFMRIKEKDLDRDDKYEGPKVGGEGGGEGTVGGDGNFIVGLHGKVNDRGKIGALSAVSLTTTAAPATEEEVKPRKVRTHKVPQ